MIQSVDEDKWEQELLLDPVFWEVNLAHLMKFIEMSPCVCQFCVPIER